MHNTDVSVLCLVVLMQFKMKPTLNCFEEKKLGCFMCSSSHSLTLLSNNLNYRTIEQVGSGFLMKNSFSTSVAQSA